MRSAATVLVIDDDPDLCLLCRQILEPEGYAVITCCDPDQGVETFVRQKPAVVLLDLRFPHTDGFEVLERLQRRDASTAVVVITAHASVESAVRAMKAGALDYITKPFADPFSLRAVVDRALAHRTLLRENQSLRRALQRQGQYDELVGNSAPMQQVKQLIERVAPTDATVLICGESGTGKELVARALHRLSHRAERPYVRISCGSLTETLLTSELFGHARGAFTGAVQRKTGLFEAADGGTLFLDEIGDTSLNLQSQLLRVLQEGEVRPVGDTTVRQVDVRVIAATNRPLEQMIAEGTFRRDLFYRLKVVVISLPPLRDRMDDLPLLVGRFLEKHGGEDGQKLSISPQAQRLLAAHTWPGNVRELEHVIERAVLLRAGNSIQPEDLPEELRCGVLSRQDGPAPTDTTFWLRTRDELEQEHVRAVLAYTQGNRSSAARILGMSRRTLYEKLRSWNVPTPRTGSDIADA